MPLMITKIESFMTTDSCRFLSELSVAILFKYISQVIVDLIIIISSLLGATQNFGVLISSYSYL